MASNEKEADKANEMIGFIVLGIVMLIWVLTWEPSDGADLPPSQGPGPGATA